MRVCFPVTDQIRANAHVLHHVQRDLIEHGTTTSGIVSLENIEINWAAPCVHVCVFVYATEEKKIIDDAKKNEMLYETNEKQANRNKQKQKPTNNNEK